MSKPRLRVYLGPESDSASVLTNDRKKHDTVTVSLGDVVMLLADAVRSRRTWLRDFEDDEITISSDLYEILLAYQQYRRPAG